MEFGTNYKDTFVKYDHPERAYKISPINHSKAILATSKSATKSITQTKSDFVRYHKYKPATPANCNTFNSNLDQQIYPGNQ